MSPKILVVDNYDSFVYTIVGYLQLLGANCDVVRNDQITATQLRDQPEHYDGILISPGPGTPAGAGASLELIGACADVDLPMLGVCLGHQSLAEYYGGVVHGAPTLMHGKTSAVQHHGQGVFNDLPTPFTATRYHSLTVEPGSVPECLAVTAWTADGVIMGLHHKTAPLHGVQFHPESVLSEHGHRLFANWLTMCGSSDAITTSADLSPLIAQQ